MAAVDRLKRNLFEGSYHVYESLCSAVNGGYDYGNRMYEALNQRVRIEEINEDFYLNSHIMQPISHCNPYRVYVQVAAKVVAVIALSLIFSGGLAFVMKTSSIVGRGFGVLVCIGLLEGIGIVIFDVYQKIMMLKNKAEVPKEGLWDFYKSLSEEQLKEEFYKLTGVQFEGMYQADLIEKIKRKTHTESAILGLLPMIVRFAFLKTQYEALLKNENKAVFSKWLSVEEEHALDYISNQNYVELYSLKLELAFAFVILMDPSTCLYEDVKQIGFFNQVKTDVIEFKLNSSNIPFFISHKASVDQKSRLNKTEYFFSFKEMGDESIADLAEKLKGFLSKKNR